MERHTETFVAFHEEDKRSETLHVFTEFKDAGSQDDPNAKIATFKQLRTSDGRVVQWKKKGVYEILDTGETLTSDALDAP